LREKLLISKDHNTVIASETIARMIGTLVKDTELPEIQGRKTGY